MQCPFIKHTKLSNYPVMLLFAFVCCSIINIQTGQSRMINYGHDEPAYVHQIKALGNNAGSQELCRVCIVLRIKVSVRVTFTFRRFMLKVCRAFCTDVLKVKVKARPL